MDNSNFPIPTPTLPLHREQRFGFRTRVRVFLASRAELEGIFPLKLLNYGNRRRKVTCSEQAKLVKTGR